MLHLIIIEDVDRFGGFLRDDVCGCCRRRLGGGDSTQPVGAHGSGFDLCLKGDGKALGREARDLAVVSPSGGSKLWR
jgi:hypothetical protein